MRRRTAVGLGALLATLALAVSGCGGTDEAAPSRLLAPEKFAAAVSEPGRATINVQAPKPLPADEMGFFVKRNELEAAVLLESPKARLES